VELLVPSKAAAPSKIVLLHLQENGVSAIPRDLQTDSQQDKVLKECKVFLGDFRRLRDLVTLRTIGRTKTGRINPSASTEGILKVIKKIQRNSYDKTEQVNGAEIQRRKEVGECLRCAWPSDKKESHRVKNCIRPIQLDKGTASYPKGKVYQRQQPSDTQSDKSSSSEDDDNSD
jgi:hypothetical protein